MLAASTNQRNPSLWAWPLLLLWLGFFSLPYGKAFEVTSLATAIYYLWHRRHYPLLSWLSDAERGFTLCFFCLFIPATLSAIGSEQFTSVLRYSLGLLRFYVAGLGIILLLHTYKPSAVTLSKVIAAIAVFWCLDGFFQLLVGHNILGEISPFSHRITGPFGDSPMLGYMLVPLCALALAFTLQQRKPLLLAGLLGCMVTAIAISGDRGAWVALFWLLLLATYPAIKQFPLKHILSLAGLCVIILTGLHIYTSQEQKGVGVRIEQAERFARYIIEGKDQRATLAKSDEHRVQIFTGSWVLFKEHPLNGIGIRQFDHAYQDYLNDYSIDGDAAYHPHQVVLEAAVSAGIIGVVGLFALYVFLLRFAVRAYRQKAFLSLGALLGIIAFLFPINTGLSLYANLSNYLLWTLLALALGYMHPQNRQSTPPNALSN